MAALDSRIDDLYRTPLGEFVDARNALVKTLSGDEAKRVRKLPKPTLVPWAVNQVYWRARATYDRVIKTGDALRKAQVAALAGRKVDLRAAGEAHRKAMADAVDAAEKMAGEFGSHPPTDALMRTFEAISLAAEPPEPHGRLTRPAQPAGFEALAGVKVAPAVVRKVEERKKEKARAIAIDRKAEAARKKHEADVRKAEAALARARDKMAEAEAKLKQSRDR